MTKKIELKDLTEENFVAARQIVTAIVEMQTVPANHLFGLLIINAITKKQSKKQFKFVGATSGLDAELHDGLRAGLFNGLNDGLRAGLRDAKLEYCGIFWSWWVARYLIAAQWGCSFDMQKLGLLFAFCRFCPIVLRSKNGYIVAPKPTKISRVITGKTKAPFEFPIYELHSNGFPTVEHPLLEDGLFFWHNVRLPSYIGKVHSADWKPEWIVTEKNSELRRILIKEIGYEKIISTLPVKKIDTWREYELLRVEVEDLPVPVQLLKMTCPSTKDIHILRTPPDMVSAEAAITWHNHGIHPSEFEIET